MTAVWNFWACLRFDFLVTPGPMVITRSLVEGFPSELTAGKLSCWNITLRDAAWMRSRSGKFQKSLKSDWKSSGTMNRNAKWLEQVLQRKTCLFHPNQYWRAKERIFCYWVMPVFPFAQPQRKSVLSCCIRDLRAVKTIAWTRCFLEVRPNWSPWHVQTPDPIAITQIWDLENLCFLLLYIIHIHIYRFICSARKRLHATLRLWRVTPHLS